MDTIRGKRRGQIVVLTLLIDKLIAIRTIRTLVLLPIFQR